MAVDGKISNDPAATTTAGAVFPGVQSGTNLKFPAALFVSAENNLSEVADAVEARANLGLEIGVDVQAYNANLATLAGIASGAEGQAKLADALPADSRLRQKLPTYVADRTALKALDTTKDTLAILMEAGRTGQFKFDSSDLSSRIRPLIGTTTAVAATKSINGYSAANVYTLAGHGIYTGCPMVSTVTANGVTAGTTYYAVKYSADDFAVATTLANAVAFTEVVLSGTTNQTFRRVADLNEAMYVIPTGFADDGSDGAWVRVQNYALANPNVVAAGHFGATGDGVTDDSAALFAASVLLSAGLANALYLPKGTYYCNTSANRVTFDHVTGLHVYGDGWASKILFGDSASQRPISFRNITGGIVEKLWFDSTGRTTGTWDNVSIVNSTGFHFRFNRVSGAAFYGVGGYGDVVFEDSLLYMQAAMDDLSIYRNHFDNCGAGNGGTPGYGVEIFPNVLSHRLSIEDNYFNNCGGYFSGTGTSALKGGSAYDGARIARNFIYNSPMSGIHCSTYESVVIEDNDILDFGQFAVATTAGAIVVGPTTHPFYLTPTCRSMSVKGNRINNVTASTPTKYAFSVTGNLTTNGPVNFEKNFTLGVGGAYLRSTAALLQVRFIGNDFSAIPITSIGVYGDAAGGAALPAVLFEGNTWSGTATNRTTTAFIILTSFTDVRFLRNRFVKGGTNNVSLITCAGAIFDGNIHEEPNVSNNASGACITVSDSNAVAYTVMNEQVVKGAAGNPISLYSGSSATPTVRSKGNRSDTTMTLTLNATPSVGGDWIDYPSASKKTMWIPVADMISATTSGPASAQVETTTNKINVKVLDFDATADEYAHFNVAFPKSWNRGTVTFQAWWTTSATDTDGVAWGLQAVAISDNEAGDASWGTPIVVTDDAQSGALEMLVSSESAAVTIAGTPAAGDICYFRVFRDVSDANDDMTEDARLIGVKLFYTTNASNDT